MTATEELRRLLDERGVEWTAEDDPEEPAYYFVTKWFANGCEQTYEEIPAIISSSLKAYCVTPAQAVDATLGRGECRMQLRDDIRGHAYQDTYECNECGEQVVRETYMGESEPPNYCPNCGRRYVG